ncbi:type I pantothenate kinase [Candidatus Providencia siddallii]|uniref:Pantothenate kinase n=1 Tax=Candidatus Providencia siddallii TaxID=1715285 RepID=A0ABM9NNU4_9GAMM
MKNKEYFYDSLYLEFDKKRLTSMCYFIHFMLSYNELFKKIGINEELSINEVIDNYLPLAYLLNFFINDSFNRKKILSKCFDVNNFKVPYLIGVAGSVAVGKSTTARLLQSLLSSFYKHKKVELITTDGFLHSNKVLLNRKIMNKKGFPQSYDMCKLIKFISQIKSGVRNLTIPIYSHLKYDIIPNKMQLVDQPDILILEGLNVLQNSIDYQECSYHRVFVSDFIDFSIYVDAEPQLLREWYISRFLKLRKSAFLDSNSYFHNYSKITEKESIEIAGFIWDEINGLNLKENILPTKKRANLIISKGKNHSIQNIHLKKFL